jgi:hypothetical protein
MNYRCLLLIVGSFVFGSGFSQRVQYSEPDREDMRQTNFEIIGKVSGNFLVHKNNRDNHAISVYDNDMKQKERVKLDFLPDRIINSDFIAYPDFSYMVYQYQKRSIVYCMAQKIDGNGKKVGQALQLDTTDIGFLANNKIYSLINSDDKQQIMVFKINSKNERAHLLTTSLFNKDLQLQRKDFLHIPMPERNDILTEFHLDNEGNLVFTRAVQTTQNDIQKLFLITKPLDSETFSERQVQLDNLYLDDIRLKVDNYNKRYILTSFYSKSRSRNIDGIYVGVMQRDNWRLVVSKASKFDDNIRNEAKGENGIKAAFNDYFLRNIIVKRDGGFLMAAESFYSTGRGLGNRNFMYGSPFMRSMDYYTYSPYSYMYPWSSWNSFGRGMSERYHAENVAVFSFDSTGGVVWSNVINKSQYDDDVDLFIGYQLVNTGDQLHFLFNKQERRLQLLTDQTISPEGQLTRVPTLKNLDKGFDFMPRLANQVSGRQIIIPCMYRNYLCFAKVEL